MKIVLDTNVVISGIFFGGPPGKILEAWRDRRIQIVLSPEILQEYELVADKLASQHKDRDAGRMLDLLATHAETVQPPSLAEGVCEDPDDDKFLACAAHADVACVISGDKHLLRVSGYQGIEVVSPRDFIDKHLNTSDA